jgi:hypothetical protein
MSAKPECSSLCAACEPCSITADGRCAAITEMRVERTWPEDADGDPPNLCNVCGTPTRYGERHSTCGAKVMAAYNKGRLDAWEEIRAARAAPSGVPQDSARGDHE